MSVRYRRNIDCLGASQLHDLREAYQALYDLPDADGDSFATLGGIHGSPSPTWCDHGSPGFLTWHRAYMKAFEKALQCVNSSVMLPFWDWSTSATTGVPDACSEPTYVNRSGDTVPNPLFSGPIPSAAGGGTTSRRSDIDSTSFAGAAVAAQSALGATPFSSFQNGVSGPHGSVHVTVGGQMGTVARAAFDPIFFLHHANVDRLRWNWQRTHLGLSLPSAEASLELAPFNKPFSSDWQLGGEVESTDALGYRCANWCFWIPPIRIWEVVPIELNRVVPSLLRDVRLAIRSSSMSMKSVEFRVFLNQADASHRSKLEDNPGFAGSVAWFGMGDEELESRARSESFDLEVNLTEITRSLLDEGAEDLELKIVAVDATGDAVDAERLDVDELELILE